MLLTVSLGDETAFPVRMIRSPHRDEWGFFAYKSVVDPPLGGVTIDGTPKIINLLKTDNTAQFKTP